MGWLLYRKIISPKPVFTRSKPNPQPSPANPPTPVLADDSSLAISSMEESLYLQRACYLAGYSLGTRMAFWHLANLTAQELKRKMFCNKLAMAAYCGYVEDVKSLVMMRAFEIDPNVGLLCSPICAAAIANNKKTVTFLLRGKFNPNARVKGGPTALWISCLNGNDEVVQRLLQSPVIEVNTRHRGKTPLAIAAEKGRIEIMRMLLARQDVDLEIGETKGPFQCATVADQAPALRLLVDKLQFPSRDVIEYYNLLLWEAVHHNKVSAVRALLQYPQIDPNSEGWATGGEEDVESVPLWNAVWHGYHEVVYELLQRPDINVQKEGFDSVLSLARNQKVVEVLLDCKAVDPNAESPLVLAVREREDHVVKLFLQRPDTNVNVVDLSGDSALSSVCELGDDEMLRLLLSRDDLDLKQQNDQGQTALWLAVFEGHEKIVHLLLERERLLVNVPDEEGITPLMLAARCGDLLVVEMLLEFGANVRLTDYQGRTALSLAEEKECLDIAERLMACHKE